MTSLGKNRGPYSVAYQDISHRNCKVRTILNTPIFDNMIKNMDVAYNYEVGYIPNGFAHRPDLIANVFNGTPDKFWLLMLINNKPDPNESFNVRERLLIPKSL
jgi:hypothetical protein